MSWTLDEPRAAGKWIQPDRGRIYGWDIRKDGDSVACMTADDVDFKEKRALAVQIVQAMNEKEK